MFYIRLCTFLVIVVINIRTNNSISIKRIADVHNPGPITSLRYMQNTGNLRTKGIFERFLRNLLELLTTTFPKRKIPKYCRILYRYIDELPYKYSQGLARRIKYLSRMYPEDLKNELMLYKRELDKRLPQRTAFLEAINEAFTLRENLLFDDYIYELKNYGSEDKLFIKKETENLINNVILKNILERLSSKDRKELQAKLKKAIREFDDSWDGL